jgi:hypothetical protein
MYGTNPKRYKSCDDCGGECCKWFLIDMGRKYDTDKEREFMKARGAKRV